MAARFCSRVSQQRNVCNLATLFLRFSLLATLLFLAHWSSAQDDPAFSQVIVSRDSLSDDGNIKPVVQDEFFFVSYPTLAFDYADGRLPASNTDNDRAFAV